MKRITLFLLLCSAISLQAQTLHTGNPMLDSAFSLAVWTMDHNTHDGILHAGAGYGGEWTRDASINSFFAASLLRPQVAERTLWSVTEDSVRIGHQYWDKMIWAIAAHVHYRVTGDEGFRQKALLCASRTMSELETACLDAKRHLFMGPAVFQDGIEAYPEPIYDPGKWKDSYVLHHPHSDSIFCLSTNIMYAMAYHALDCMERSDNGNGWEARRATLIRNIVDQFYDHGKHQFHYLIDHQGNRHDYQEGLGVSLALLSDAALLVDGPKVLKHLHLTPYGIPSVYPSFPRNSKEKPGRHNMMIWPHVNAFYAHACAKNGNSKEFYRELENMARLAMVNGQGNFYEIYTIEGQPSGGWQCGSLWDRKEHQTWCATGYISLWLYQVFGINPAIDHLTLNPMGMQDGSECTLSGFHWRGCDITITVRGRIKHRSTPEVYLNGVKQAEKEIIIIPNQGSLHYEIMFGNL